MASKFSTASGSSKRKSDKAISGEHVSQGTESSAFAGLSGPNPAVGRADLLARAVASVFETLEDRKLFAGDTTTVQSLPYSLEFNSPTTGVLDKNGNATGFTLVMPNKDGTEYQPSLLDMSGGRLKITTTGSSTTGGPWENDNTLVDGVQTQFNGSAGSFSISTRLIGPLGYLDKANEQGGLLFGPDQDNYIKLVAVAQPTGQFLQFVDEQKPSTSYVHQIPSASSYTNIGSFAAINTLDLTLAGDASTGQITAYYRVNGGTLQQATQSLTLSGAQKAKFFNAAARAGLIAMQKNTLAAETLVFENFSITSGTPSIARPSVLNSQSQPTPGQTDVKRDSFVSVAVNLPNVGKGVDSATLNKSTVKLYRTSDKVAVSGHASTSGAGDTITWQPDNPLDANTQFTFEVTAGVKDTSGATFVPYTMSFTTGSRITPTDPDLSFEKIALPTATGQQYSCVTIGPDGKLYATSLSGLVQRFTINSDGTLSSPQNITTVQTNNGGNRFISSITFDPASTSGNLIAYVSHGYYAFENAPDFSGKIAKLTGANLENYQELVTGLPRAVRDHLNNQLNFGPDGNLYFAQGSSSAMGAADAAWGLRPEHLLTAAVLKLDMAKINTRISNSLGALNVQTEGLGGSNYDPWDVNAPLTIYATGVRNAYDLVWTRDGYLYAPTNGSAAGGSVPSSTAGTFSGTRIDQGTNGPFTTPTLSGITNIPVTEDDFLFKIQQGGYYGHPNTTRGEYVLNGGNPSDLVDYEELSLYPTGTMPDRNYQGAAYVFGKSHSPDGAIEYKGAFLNGKLDGKLLVVRYSGGADVVALTRDSNGNITNAESNISGLTGFINPLDLTQDVSNGNLYIADYGANAIYLARPVAPGARITTDKSTLYLNDDYGSSNTTPSAVQKIRISNNGTQPLVLGTNSLTLSNTTNWVLTKPTLPASIAPGDYVEVGIQFKATSASGVGIKTATLTITSNDSTRPTVVVNLRGLAAQGTGGQNEPSLQRILDLYQIPVVTGDTNAADTNLLSNTVPMNSVNDEVVAQHFVKADTGPVTIEPLATFAGGTPAVRFGYYDAGTATAKTELLSVAASDAQTVNPTLLGTTSFDPGTKKFGLYANFPIFDNTAYSEDSLNVKENTLANRRKFRFYPLKTSDGTLVPNAYVFTSEDYVNDTNGAYDTNDFMGIIRNVALAPTGPELGLENTDGMPFANQLSFNRVQIQPPDPHIDQTTGVSTPTPNNVVHDTAVVRIRNTGTTVLTLNSLTLSNATAWTLVSPPANGTTIAAGGYLDVTVKFVAQSLPSWPGYNSTIDLTGQAANYSGFYTGSLTIRTDDADEGTQAVSLSGWWQQKSERNMEPSLPTVVNTLFGFKTKVLNTGQTMADAANGANVLGEEVLSRYWVRADGSAPVKVQQLAAYHTQGNTAKISWAPYGNSGALSTIFTHDGDDGQSLLPHLDGSTALAAGTFKPTTNVTTNPLGAFQFKLDTEWSDDSLQKPVTNNPNDNGHHVRFWPARDQSGNLIPNTWLVAMDYLGINYDYQDNVYLVTNMKPMPPAAPASLTLAASASGIGLDWADLTGTPLLSGYNVYRSTASTGPWSKLNADPVAASQYLDATAAAGTTYYYRVTAQDSWLSESGVSNVVSGTRTQDSIPPASPTGLSGVGVASGVTLTWSAVADLDVAGYRVYRSDTLGGTYTLIAGNTPVSGTSYTDSTATAGSTWYYEVSAVDTSGNESTLSSPASALAGDTTAPAVPAGVTASSTDTGIRAGWTAVTDSDLAGYRVYRSNSGTGTFTLVSGGGLVNATSWVDTSAQVGETWFYKVSAVDVAGNESAQSTTAAGATRVAATQAAIRINVGGGSFTDGASNVWQADQYFTGGTVSTSSFDVAGTTDDSLYLARRYGEYTYSIPVSNGRYTLNLHLMDPVYTATGKRTFNVLAEGATILSNFDIVANGGGKAKLVKSFTVNVTDGFLTIQTVKILDNPIISAIEIIPVTFVPTAPTGVVGQTLLNGASIAWTPSAADPAPTGYNVYRASSIGGTYIKINTAIVTTSKYSDLTLAAGTTGFYKVTAVYAGGTESDPTTAISVAGPVAGTGNGLLGQYYAGTNFNTLKMTRTDATVNYDWGNNAVSPAMPTDNFSVRWTGQIQAAVTGDYTFGMRTGDAVRVWVNGVLVIDQWTPQGLADYTSGSPITLTAGQSYSIRIDYAEYAGSASAKFYWQIPGSTKQLVSRQYLYSA